MSWSCWIHLFDCIFFVVTSSHWPLRCMSNNGSRSFCAENLCPFQPQQFKFFASSVVRDEDGHEDDGDAGSKLYAEEDMEEEASFNGQVAH